MSEREIKMVLKGCKSSILIHHDSQISQFLKNHDTNIHPHQNAKVIHSVSFGIKFYSSFDVRKKGIKERQLSIY